LGPSRTPLLLQALAFHITAVRVPQTVDVLPVAERAGLLIDDATGLNVQIMVRTRVSADTAFQVLVEMSQHSNTLVRVVWLSS
jgi:hypothetical protein